ncbi:MAG: hypothetical protein ABJE10_20730 [bacterium]
MPHTITRFRHAYPNVDALFNAFDFGHAALYEAELRHPLELTRVVDTVLYQKVTTRVLAHPSHVTLDEHAIAPGYTTLAPELVATFEWAHMLHRQLYDILADPRMSDAERDVQVADEMRYYCARRDLALSRVPKSMTLMEGQPFSLTARKEAPAYNALIWSYHWLQMAIYEVLLAAPMGTERDALMHRSLAAFWAMGATRGQLPSVMPMSPAIAPRFTERYPEAAAVFDNLHALHDVTGDILASPLVLQSDKRPALLKALTHYQDDVTAATSRDEWKAMARAMDATKMGGVVTPISSP